MEEVLTDAVGAVGVLMGATEVLVGVLDAGRCERFGSLVKVADKPVTFTQTLGGATVPDTKLTAAHCKNHQFIAR